MIDGLTIALALALGLLAGSWVGATLALSLERRRRRLLRVNGLLARIWSPELPGRSAADMLAGVVHVRLGGRVFDLPVLSRSASRRWSESLDARFAAFASTIEAATDDTPAILGALAAETDGLYDLLLSYDAAGAAVLPPLADIDDVATDTEILRAIIEVWRAVNPKAAIGAAPTPSMNGSTHASPTTSPGPTAGAPTGASS